MTDKPDLTKVWAENADPTDIKNPDLDEAGKFQLGWLTEVPPHTWFNYIQNNFSAALSHFNEYGIAQWDTDTVYPVGGWARSTVDGYVYVALVAQSGNEPSASPSQWKNLNVELKSGRKNYLINGNFDIWQRGEVFTNPVDVAYTADRWGTAWSFTPTNLNINRTPFILGDSVLSLSFDAVGAGLAYLSQKIEKAPLASSEDFTASFSIASTDSKTMACSLWVKHDSGTFSLGSLGFTSPAGAFERKVFTFNTGDLTAYSFDTTEFVLELRVEFMTGSAWTGGNFSIAKVQLEKGTIATDFEYRPFAEDLALCQRYFVNDLMPNGVCLNGTAIARANVSFPVEMRVAPDIAFSAGCQWFYGTGTATISGGITTYSSTTSFSADVTVSEGGPVGQSAQFMAGSGQVQASAEL